MFYKCSTSMCRMKIANKIVTFRVTMHPERNYTVHFKPLNLLNLSFLSTVYKLSSFHPNEFEES